VVSKRKFRNSEFKDAGISNLRLAQVFGGGAARWVFDSVRTQVILIDDPVTCVLLF
jgi:hypothetical protein